MMDFEITHFHPGRLRARLARVSQDPLFAEQLRQTIGSIGGVTAVSTRSLTGSVLICYDPASLDLDALLCLGKVLGLVPVDLLIPNKLLGIDTLSAPVGGVNAAAEALVDRLAQAMSAVLERGSRLAGQALDPRLAVSAVGLNAAVRVLGIKTGLAVSPPFAAAWIAASIILGPRRPPGVPSALAR